MRRIIPTALLLLTLSLAGCSTGMSASDESSGQSSSDQSVVEPAPAPAEGEAGSDSSGFVGARDEDRQIVTTGFVTVTAEEPLDAASDAVRIVEAAGGRVDARNETAPTPGDRGSATLTLRIPSAKLTATLDELKTLGETEQVSLSSVDVTTQTQDLDARITASRASVDRLTALLATATDTEVLIKLETAISERQGELESMEAQRRGLADQVSMSTLDLNLISEADAPVDSPDTFWSGLETGWTAFVDFVGFLLVALGVLLPWAVVAGVAVLVVLLVLRRQRRRAVARSDAAKDEIPGIDAAI
ncbi:hypothetical protein HD599_000469 [Conyzicola lurida]|uniref:DUF4349 domain-containing protein n=1 Tax=Conyzicola lurida TaxID=1172621 RepID=A0A841AK96_9MICO|nr:DUF4349 domain-containing protein [Conyzicola lurida]MBB5842146.1 hypothetical protein [Conyzicola lurida]